MTRYNRLLGLRLGDAGIDDLAARIKAGELPDNLAISPQSRPLGLESALATLGFEVHMRQTGMAIGLDGWASGPADPRIITIETDGQCDEWTSVAETAFGSPRDRQLFRALRSQHGVVMKALVAEGRIAATLLILLRETDAGLHTVGTLPSFRRQGLGHALTRQALDEIAAAGRNTVVLQASALGRSVYEALGFKDCGEIVHMRLAGPAGAH